MISNTPSINLRLCFLLLFACFIIHSSSSFAAEKKATVHKIGDAVWLECVNGWFCGDKESSVHAAQEAVMQAVGENVTYAYQLGVSSLAFRFQISKEGLCPSSPHSCCGYECVDNSVAALPWKITAFSVKPEDTAKVAEARQAVVDSINRGVPVQYGCEEDGLIVGYQKNGEEWICLHYFKDANMKKTFIETQWPWGIAVYTGPKDKMLSRRELAISALQQALKMAGTEESDGYYVGFKAWQNYIEKLKALESADEKTRVDSMHGNAWNYECLTQYRSAGAVYLREIAGEFNPDTAKHLLKAADIYDKQANQVLRDKDHCVITIAPYPSMLKTGEKWVPKTIKEQIRRLTAAFNLEREAIKQIQEAEKDWNK
jgi:hypothetical protein